MEKKDEHKIRIKHSRKNKSERRRSSSRAKLSHTEEKPKHHSSQYLVKLPKYIKKRNPFCAGFHYNKTKPHSSSSESSSEYESSSEEEIQPMSPHKDRRNYYQQIPQMNTYTYPVYAQPMAPIYPYPYLPQISYPYSAGFQPLPDPWAGYPLGVPMNKEMSAPTMYRQYPN